MLAGTGRILYKNSHRVLRMMARSVVSLYDAASRTADMKQQNRAATTCAVTLIAVVTVILDHILADADDFHQRFALLYGVQVGNDVAAHLSAGRESSTSCQRSCARCSGPHDRHRTARCIKTRTLTV